MAPIPLKFQRKPKFLEIVQSFSPNHGLLRTIEDEGNTALHMKGVEMESNEVTAVIELLAETFGGAMATRNESERDALFQFAGALASVLTVKEMVLATNQAVEEMSDEDLQYWLHADGFQVVGKEVSGRQSCPAVPAQNRAPGEHEELDVFRRSLQGRTRYAHKRSPRRASPNLRSMRLGDEAI